MQTLAPSRTRQLKDFQHYGFAGGVNIQDGPQELADNDLTGAVNVYLDPKGDVIMRKGMNVKGVQFSTEAGNGLVRFYQNLQNGAVVNAAGVTLAQAGGTLYNPDTNTLLSSVDQMSAGALPWSTVKVLDPNHLMNAPIAPTLSAPTGGGSLAAGTYRVAVSYVNAAGETTTSPDSLVTVTANQEFTVTSPAARGNAVSYRIYVSTVGGATNTETRQFTVAIGTNQLISAVAAGAALPGANTATAASDVLIICVGNGVGPFVWDGIALSTYAGSPTTVTGARWCALVNNVLYFAGIPSQPNLLVAASPGSPEALPGYGTFTTSQPITGLGYIGIGFQTQLVAGMTTGLVLFSGVTPNSYTEQEIPNQDGVVAGRSMITVDGILYFVGNYAIYRYDGTTFTEISRKVRPWLLNDPAHQEFPMNGTRTNVWSMYWNRKIYFWYPSNVASLPNTALVWDLEVSGWTIYTGVTLNAAAILDAPGDPSPPTCVVIDATKGQQYQFDAYVDNNFNVADAGVQIASMFVSKFFKIGTAGCTKHMLRTKIEMFLLTFTGLFNLITDYNTTSSNALSLSTTQATATWDQSVWDGSQWASTLLAYISQRLDWNVSFEAVAFGIQTPGPTTPAGAYQIWRFMGLTGRFSEFPRS